MSKGMKAIAALIIVLVLVVVLRSFFILHEGRQAVVTRFGAIVKVHTEAGLKLKAPLIDKVKRYSTKVLSWDSKAQRIMPTGDNQFIRVDTTARWRIIDPTVFYKRVNTMDRAYNRLDDVIESAVRNIISQYPFAESVRSTNIILESSAVILDFQTDAIAEAESEAAAAAAETPVGDGADPSEEQEESDNILQTAFVPISVGREQLSNEMLMRSQPSMPQYGIELLDVAIRQIRYSDDLTQPVYERMISERKKVAAGYRADGDGRKAEWLGRLNRDRDIKLTQAERQAAQTRAEGDAQAARIYAQAYSADAEFYSFWMAMESYRKVLPGKNKVLTTDMDYFRFLHDIR